jgi:hypothetical protein
MIFYLKLKLLSVFIPNLYWLLNFWTNRPIAIERLLDYGRYFDLHFDFDSNPDSDILRVKILDPF